MKILDVAHGWVKGFLAENVDLLWRSGLALFFRVIGAASSFILGVVLARKLGAAESGVFFIVFNMLVLASAAFRCGFDDVLLRLLSVSFSAERWVESKATFIFSICFVLFFSAAGAFLIFLGSDFLANEFYSKPDLAPVIEIMVWSSIGLSGLTLCAVALQSAGRVVSSVLTLNVFSNITSAILIHIYADDVFDAAIIYVLSTFGSFLFGLASFYFPIFKLGGGIGGRDFRGAATSILPGAMRLWPVLILSQFLLLVGQFFTGVFASEVEAAYYAAAQRSAMLVSFVLMAVNLIVAPRFAQLYGEKNYEAVQKLAKSSIVIVLFFAMPASALMFFMPSFFISLFGTAFVAGVDVLRILVVGQLINVAFGPMFYILLMSGGERESRRVVMVVFPLSIIFGYVFTVSYGVNGAAFSSLLIFIIQGILTVQAVNKKYGRRMIGFRI